MKSKKCLLILVLTLAFIVIISIILKSRRHKKGKKFHFPSKMGKNFKFPEPIVIKNILTPEECDYLIKKAEPLVVDSMVNGATNTEKSKYRTSKNTFLPTENDPILKKIDKLTAKLTGKPICHQEDLQVVSYENGQEYKEHYDPCDDPTAFCNEDKKKGGYRFATIFIYLTDDFEDGGTHFPKLNKTYKPTRGDGIFWYSYDPTGTIKNIDSLHAGLPVKVGKKWGCNKWIRANGCYN